MILLNTNLCISVCLYMHTPCYCNNVPWLWLKLTRFLKVSIQDTWFWTVHETVKLLVLTVDGERKNAWTGHLHEPLPRTDQLRVKPCLQSNPNIINVMKYFQCQLIKSLEVQKQLTISTWQSSSCEGNSFPGIFLFRKLVHFSFIGSIFSVHGKVLSGCGLAYVERQQRLSHSRYSWFQPVFQWTHHRTCLSPSVVCGTTVEMCLRKGKNTRHGTKEWERPEVTLRSE